MIKMRKAQLSFEFILLFTILMFFFVSVSYVMLLSGGVQEKASTKKIAESMTKEIKVRFITASLSVTEFSSSMFIPTEIDYVKLNVSFHSDPDNMIQIKNMESGELIARAFLPIVDVVVDPVVPGATGPVINISVVKNAANEIIVYVERE
jgi:hypothetical protein